jgi:hypothetical protein
MTSSSQPPTTNPGHPPPASAFSAHIPPAQAGKQQVNPLRLPRLPIREPSQDSVYETFSWEVRYNWGALRFGIRVKDDCLATIAIDLANLQRPGDCNRRLIDAISVKIRDGLVANRPSM